MELNKTLVRMANNISDYYNKIYSENKMTFGIEPLPLVRRVLDYIKSGKVIEFGAGEGRNSLFLAANGFRVTAVDISPVAIEKIKERAKQESTVLETKVADITKLRLQGLYDLAVCTFTLHHLKRGQALRLLTKIKNHTKSGGFNVITAFTKIGDFYKKDQGTGKFYLDRGELKDSYKDWEILAYFEKKGTAFAKHPNGRHMVNIFAGVIAKKVLI